MRSCCLACSTVHWQGEDSPSCDLRTLTPHARELTASGCLPHAQADDDIWTNLNDVANSLRSSVKSLARLGYPNLYWGIMEAATWNETANLPGPWPDHRWLPCSWRPGHLHGPFPYSKGPLYFVSRALISRFAADENVTRAAERTIRDGESRHHRGCSRCARKPWEDIFTGFGISRMAQHGVHIGIVDVTWRFFAENWGVKLSPSTLLWHAKRKRPDDLRRVHAWVSKHHCSVPESAPAECPPMLYRMPCGWHTFGLTRHKWLRANRSIRVPWQICRAPGAGREQKFCDETVVRIQKP